MRNCKVAVTLFVVYREIILALARGEKLDKAKPRSLREDLFPKNKKHLHPNDQNIFRD